MAVRFLSTVTKTLAVLDAIGRESQPSRLADLCRVTGEARAAVYQRVVTLVDAGWVEPTSDGAYRLSLRVVSHANTALEQASLGSRFTDLLHGLVTTTGETASIAVLDGAEALIVQRAEAKGILRADLHVGTRLELGRTALGRALASHARPEIRATLLAHGVELPGEDAMAEVRSQGYSISTLNGPRTVSAVASPIFDSVGACIAAVSLSGPTAGFDTAACARAVKGAAERASARMLGLAA